MIQSKQDYIEYRRLDLLAHQLTKCSFYNYWWRDCVRFQLRLRKIEYLHNVKRNNPFCCVALFILEILQHRLSTRLGFSIPKNVFGPGLCIVHYGTIVVSPQARIGAFCRIHPNTSIGDYNGVPSMGDYCYIGPGAKLYGSIQIGNNVAVGANAVVNQSVSDNQTVAGVPAKTIAEHGAIECGVYPTEVVKYRNVHKL